MKCDNIIQQLDNHFDGELTENEHRGVMDHLAECPSCRSLFDNEKQLRQALKELPIPEPGRDFRNTVIPKAIARAQRQTFKKAASLGGLLAACLVLWIAVWSPVSFRQNPDSAFVGQYTMQLNSPKEIKVLLTAEEDLEMASVTIRLSDNLEIKGYPASREISWQTNIKKGKNFLSLPVIAKMSGKAELVAEVNHQDKSKLLKVNMIVQKPSINSQMTYNRYTV